MPRHVVRCVAVLLLVLSAGCTHHPPLQRVYVPPRIDLKPFETIGVIEFTSSSKGRIAAFATRRFTEAARRDQEMIRMMDIGSQKAALASVGGGNWSPENFQAIGRKAGVKTLFQGKLTFSDIRPTVALSALFKSGQVTANVAATLEVQMIEVETGASIWSRSGSATRQIGQVSVIGGKDYIFDAADPEAAYGDLIDELVAQVARDFQGTWQLQ